MEMGRGCQGSHLGSAKALGDSRKSFNSWFYPVNDGVALVAFGSNPPQLKSHPVGTSSWESECVWTTLLSLTFPPRKETFQGLRGEQRREHSVDLSMCSAPILC